MKGLVKIVVWGFLVFLALAMIEEREVFLPLFGLESAPRPETGEADEAGREEVVRALDQFLTLMAHLYSSGGDRRFAERLPASRGVIDEILAEIVYLQHNQRRQEMSLLHREVTDVSLARGWARVRTKEYWVVETLWSHHAQGPSEPRRSTIAHVEYLLEREAQQWSVQTWSLTRPAEASAAPAPAGAAGRGPPASATPPAPPARPAKEPESPPPDG